MTNNPKTPYMWVGRSASSVGVGWMSGCGGVVGSGVAGWWCVFVWGGGNECVVVMAIVRLWVGASVEVVNGVGAVGVGLRVPRALNHPLPTHQHTDVRSSCLATHAATSYQHINSPEP